MHMLDPLSAREFVQAAHTAKKNFKRGVLKEEDIDRMVAAFEALDIVFADNKPHAKLGSDVLGVGQAVVRGEAEIRDESGHLVMGDRLMELAEQLYAAAEEREGE